MRVKAMGAAAALALAVPAVAAAQAPLRFTDAELFIEINATDGDAGLQMSLGGREWERLRLIDPRRRTILDVRAGGSLDGWGLTDMGFESAEPSFDRTPFRRFRQRFPEGRYRFVATAPNGRRVVGSDRLTHVVPDGPRVLAPAENAVVDPSAVVVRWDPVTTPSAIRIVRYQVIVTPEDTGGSVRVDLAPTATSAAIPAGVLTRNAEYAVEVIARASNGNQTITEVGFRTAP
jgi:Fibronectin type III domain